MHALKRVAYLASEHSPPTRVSDPLRVEMATTVWYNADCGRGIPDGTPSIPMTRLRNRTGILSVLTVGALFLLAGIIVTIRPALAQNGTTPTCSTGTAVPDPTNNPGLVSDCEALLAARDTLAGDATLNWSADTPIADWDGITLEGRRSASQSYSFPIAG